MKEDIFREAPPTGVIFESDTEIERLVETLASVYYRIDTDIGKLRDSRYVETADGRELERKARPLGIFRKKGENDERLRLRALGGRGRATSNTTFNELAELALLILEAEPEEVEFELDYGTEPGALIVASYTARFDESPLTEDEIVELLEGALPMNRRVIPRRLDGFQFSLPSTTSQKEGSGFNQGAWTQGWYKT